MFIILKSANDTNIAINVNNITRVYENKKKTEISIWDSESDSIEIPNMNLEQFITLVNYAKGQ